LIKNGVRSSPPTLNPTISPAIWTTAVTGVSPQRHGVNNFISLNEEDYTTQLITSEDRRVKALWNILSEAGLKVGVFSYWATWPAEQINGYVVTEQSLFSVDRGVSPDRLKNDIMLSAAKELGFSVLGKDLEVTFPEPKSLNDAAFFKVAHDQFALLTRLFSPISLALFDKEKPDVLFQIAGTVDASQHLFLKFLWPEKFNDVDPTLVQEYGNFIEEIYIEQDKLLGEYIKRSGPNTNIIVMSDHGHFADPAGGYRVEKFNVLLSYLGLLQYLPNGKVDFAKSVAFECNNNTFDWQRRLCINIQGKYQDGIVPQQQYEAMRDRIVTALESVKTRDGQSMFVSVGKSERDEADVVYDIKRSIVDDIIVIGDREIAFKDFLKLSIESGNHYADPTGPLGIFVWVGPNIRKGVRVSGFDYTDIAPNILHALGLPIPRDMEGDYFGDFYEHPTEPTYIDSYEDSPQQFYSGNHEKLEENDQFITENNELYIHSVLDEGDSGDRFCFEVAPGDKRAKVQRFEHVPSIVKNFVAWDNPAVTGTIPFVRDVLLSSFPRTDIHPINIKDIKYPPDADNLYRISVPLDITRPTYLGMWSNVSVSTKVAGAGVMRITARGDAVEGRYPHINVLLNKNHVGDITILSNRYETYDTAIPGPGVVEFWYDNDEFVGNEDKNVYIQSFKYSASGAFDAQINSPLFFEENQLCFNNKTAGTTELHMQLFDVNDGNIRSEAQEEIIELLQRTGEINDE